MSKWLNNKTIIHSPTKASEFKVSDNDTVKYNIEKPCHKTGICPYGQLVEEFPFNEENDKLISCDVFGHDCPVFYLAEPFAEDILCQDLN